MLVWLLLLLLLRHLLLLSGCSSEVTTVVKLRRSSKGVERVHAGRPLRLVSLHSHGHAAHVHSSHLLLHLCHLDALLHGGCHLLLHHVGLLTHHRLESTRRWLLLLSAHHVGERISAWQTLCCELVSLCGLLGLTRLYLRLRIEAIEDGEFVI